MLRHYLTFAHQAAALDESLSGWTLAECWSQQKNHLLLRFVRERESRFVELAVDLHVGYALMKNDAGRARRNTIDFFGSLLGSSLRTATIDDGERAVRFHFNDGRQLVAFFFGKGSGNVLLMREGEVLETFQKYDGEYDSLLVEQAHPSMRSREEIIEAIRGDKTQPVKAIAHAIPELGSRLALEALTRAGLADAASLARLDDDKLLRLLEVVDALYQECEISEAFYVYHLENDAVFALTELRSIAPHAERIEIFDDIASAIRAHRSISTSAHRLADLRSRMLKRLHGEATRIARSLDKRYNAEEHLKRAEEWDRQASTILANLHLIEKGTDEARLVDWEGVERVIPLNRTLTPAENAEHLFRRARGAREAAQRNVDGKAKIESELARVETLIERIELSESLRELESIHENNRKLFAMTGEPKEKGTAERFRRFEVVGGHEVYVGKNASNNDELTVRFARPNDYWMHARGSSGSHVVLRWNDAKSKPPKEVLRAAASLAAYYSGARNAKMVPVAYTLKKYVRKPRGAAVGAVVMDREEVVLVEPKLPYGSSEG